VRLHRGDRGRVIAFVTNEHQGELRCWLEIRRLGQRSGMTPEVLVVEYQPILEVESQREGQQACVELRAHGIECSCTEIAQPAADLICGMSQPKLPRLCVVVARDDADRAATILQAA
jgi:hypothetical protein